MGAFAKAPQRSHVLGVLFDNDFDLPEVVPEPEVIEPLFSAAEVAAAREAARRDGHAAGLQEAASSDATAVRQALEAIASQFKDERDAAARRADQSAEAIARLLLDSLAATFPVLCARHGEAEVRAIARAVLPALTLEPMIAVRVNPSFPLSKSINHCKVTIISIPGVRLLATPPDPAARMPDAAPGSAWPGR
jgi:hypothetical protein